MTGVQTCALPIYTPCEPITNAAKYLADMVISNGFHEDTVLGEDKEILRWLYSRPDNKKMLAEFLAFADTGLADFQLEKRSGDVEVLRLWETPVLIPNTTVKT